MENAVTKFLGDKIDRVKDSVEENKAVSLITAGVVVAVGIFLVVRKIVRRKKKLQTP